jgi:hypothetical protein
MFLSIIVRKEPGLIAAILWNQVASIASDAKTKAQILVRLPSYL